MYNQVLFVFGAMSDSSYDIGINFSLDLGFMPRVGEQIEVPYQNHSFRGEVYNIQHLFTKTGINHYVFVKQISPGLTVNAEILEEEAKRKNSLNDTNS